MRRRGGAATGASAAGELGPHRVLHLAGQLAEHVVEQRQLHPAMLVEVREEHVGDAAQQLPALFAGGFLGEGDEVLKL